MAKSQKVISIPKPPASAYNKNRPVSELLWMQVEYLAAVVKKDIDDQTRARKVTIDDERRVIRTEGEASDFIKKYTAILHPDGARKRPTRSSRSASKKARSSKG